jgi:CubicO group peptidase (beta-lactamase class C family)
MTRNPSTAWCPRSDRSRSNISSRTPPASGRLSSTAADFLRFEQMFANKGTLFGNRILSPQSIATMSSNQVGELYQGKGKQSGVGFG